MVGVFFPDALVSLTKSVDLYNFIHVSMTHEARATNWWMFTLIRSEELILSLSWVIICGKYIARLSHAARLPLVSNGSVMKHLKI